MTLPLPRFPVKYGDLRACIQIAVEAKTMEEAGGEILPDAWNTMESVPRWI